MIAAFCASVDRFAREHIDARRIDRDHRIGPEVLAGLAELGAFGVTIPEEHGGSALGLPGACALVTTLARHDRAVATTVGLHLGLGTRGLVAYGSPALKQAWLPELAAGRRIAAFATTESEAGSDLAAIRTRAVATADGDGLEVGGEKIFVTNGGFAGVYTITASTPGLGGARRGHSLLLLTREDPGLSIGAEEEKLGLRGSSTTTLHLDGVRLPMDRVIGAPGAGMAQLAHVLAWGRTVMAAGCVGSASAALEAAVAHVGQRKQFGRTLDSFEVVQDQVAGMAALRFAMQALVEAAAAAGEDGSVPDRLPARSIAAKILCSEGAWEIIDTSLQLFGGSGCIEETGLALLLRDARVTRIFEGANDVLRVHLGLLEASAPAERRPLSGRSASGRGADALHALVEEHRHRLTRRHGIRLARAQRQLHRLGQLAALRDACDAAVARAVADVRPSSEALAAAWVSRAWARAAPLVAELSAPDAAVGPGEGMAPSRGEGAVHP